MSNDAEALGVDYQRAGQVRQLLGERANAVAYGATDRVAGIDKTLAEMGYEGDLTIGVDGDPRDRATPAEKQVRTAPTEQPASVTSGSRFSATGRKAPARE